MATRLDLDQDELREQLTDQVADAVGKMINMGGTVEEMLDSIVGLTIAETLRRMRLMSAQQVAVIIAGDA